MRKATTQPAASRLDRAREAADLAEQRNRAANARLRAKAIRACAGRLDRIIEGREESNWRSGPVAMGSFHNETRGRLRSGTRPRGGASWVHYNRAARENLRKDSQDAKRNNVVARSLIHRHADFLVGDGAVVKPTAREGDPEKARQWNKDVKKKFDDWCLGRDPMLGRPNLRGLSTFWQDLAAVPDAWCTDGDRLACAVTDDQGRTTIQWHAAETIVNRGGEWADTETMVGGVEFEATAKGPGAVKFFHVAGYDKSGTTLRKGTWALPAASCFFLPNPTGYDPEQVRGEPALQAALDWLDLLNGYIEDTALAAQVATWIGLVFHSDKPAELQDAIIAATSNQADTSGKSSTASEMEFGPGFTFACKPGQTPTQIKPEFPTTSFKEYVLTIIQLIGADLGLPLAIALFLTGDLNFSTLRGLISMAARGFDKKQGVLSAFVSWVYKLKVQEWVAKGIVDARDDWDSHSVKLPPPPVVDLKMESETYDFMVEHNLTTRGAAVELLGFYGGTYEELIEERRREVELEAAAGVTPPMVPGAVRGGSKPETNKPASPTEPDKAEPAEAEDE